MKLEDTTIGIKSFYRPEKVHQCLKSIEKSKFQFSKIIVADDGPIREQKQEIYDSYSESLDIEVLDLEYDLGLAASRNRMVDATDDEFFLLMDDDMKLPSNVNRLIQVMRGSNLGGVSGVMKQNGNVRAGAHDIAFERDILVRKIQGAEERNIVGNKVRIFDFIPTCSVLRTEMLKNNPWDEEFIICKEHLDFFTHHKTNSDWEFGILEDIIFNHNPGGEIEFEKHRESENKRKSSLKYFLRKWNIQGIAQIETHLPADDGRVREMKTKAKKFLPNEVVAEMQRKRILA
jgi:glycosyltransferase involved in cell wall biosynthesis